MRAIAEPELIEASDGTLHAFPHGTPDTDIERYMWRYENGQDLPDSAFSGAYDEARCSCGEDVYIPPPRGDLEVTAQKDETPTPVLLEGFENPGAVFDSREAAAYDVTSRVNPVSRERNREFTWIYYTDPASGKIGYSDPYEIGKAGGRKIDLSFTINGAEARASDGSRLTVSHSFGGGHTHGRKNPGDLHDSDKFSDDDVKAMRRGGDVGTWRYFTLGTPSGRFLQWTPEEKTQRLRNE